MCAEVWATGQDLARTRTGLPQAEAVAPDKAGARAPESGRRARRASRSGSPVIVWYRRPMKAPQVGRVAALGYVLQRDVTPSIGVATDRYLLGDARTARPTRRAARLRVSRRRPRGRPLAPGARRRRRSRRGLRAPARRAAARSPSGKAISASRCCCRIARRSSPTIRSALAPFQVPNRYVRGLMRALEAARPSRVLSRARSRDGESPADRRRQLRDRRGRTVALRGDRRGRPSAQRGGAAPRSLGHRPASSRAICSRSKAARACARRSARARRSTSSGRSCATPSPSNSG